MEWVILSSGGLVLGLLLVVAAYRLGQDSALAAVRGTTDHWLREVEQVYGAQGHTYIDLERDSSDDIRVKLERLRR